MSRELNVKIGQEVYAKIEASSNRARRIKITLENSEEWIFKGEVIKAGKKYITVKFDEKWEEQFSVEDDYRQKYTYGGADYKLYLSMEDAIEEVEKGILYSCIKYKFNEYDNDLTVEQLRKIKEIIEN